MFSQKLLVEEVVVMGITEILREANKHPCHRDCSKMDAYGRNNGFCEHSKETNCTQFSPVTFGNTWPTHPAVMVCSESITCPSTA